MQKTESTSKLITRTKKITVIRRTLWILNHIYHQALTVLSVIFLWVMYENSDKSNSFFWHIFLSTAAYIPLMASAIILFSEDNLITLYITRTKKYFIHGVLLGVSALFVTIGISLEVHSKNKRGSKHFKSDHAILGLVSWVLVLLSVVIGLVAANTRIFSNYIKPVVAKFVHNFLGIAAFILGVASFYKEINYFKSSLSEHAFDISRYATWIVAVWSVINALKSLKEQITNILF
ncbi:hypothetical protein GWI33_022241 [Rhynchophorus ferrugineus]|uniref:ascorbate ferrireductase (transmembrane) n=1 Tax=Rhynchophorus ferrugineus TaxID=354439 RepID=A0A834HS33_RHYFE|nr:hypothetical protein GWI33_022241 [Rhynchophorus ferrugineus]